MRQSHAFYFPSSFLSLKRTSFLLESELKRRLSMYKPSTKPLASASFACSCVSHFFTCNWIDSFASVTDSFFSSDSSSSRTTPTEKLNEVSCFLIVARFRAQQSKRAIAKELSKIQSNRIFFMCTSRNQTSLRRRK